MEEFKNKSYTKGNYKQPKVEVVNFDYTDVITASACEEDRYDCPENT